MPRATTVLCVDDDEYVARTLVHVLQSKGFHTESAANGREAIEKVEGDLRRFDIIVTDHRMPLMGGLALVRRLRELQFPGGILVHCSPLAPRDQSDYEAIGIRHFLPKPTDLALIIQAVKLVANAQHSQSSVALPTNS